MLGLERAAADHGCRHAGTARNPNRPGKCCSGKCSKTRKKRVCSPGSCPQPPATESCTEAYCSTRFKCGFRNKPDNTECDGGGRCVAGACEQPPVPSCMDGIKNGTETDVDCGGMCSACADDQHCVNDFDCISAHCCAGVCRPSCPTP